ncbi:MAG: cadherin repeat domain-containing protein [Gammaproteobacteria bacterium]|nr:cadherin repeat domain-containing protein [Gammaproteobacteria bacterium]
MIEVTDANEAPTVTVTGGATVPNDDMTVSSLTVEENRNGSELAPLALITLADPDDGEALKGQAAADKITISDDRFTTKLDPEDGVWLALRDDESLDHETAATIDLTVTFEDKGGLTASASATVTVSDVNEKPFVTNDDMGNPRTLDPVFATVGEDIDITVHLAGLFDDPDDDDGTFKYDLRTDPGLRKSGDSGEKGQLGFDLSIERGTDKDGKETITGTISSDGSVWSNHLPGTFDITVVATDDDDDTPLPGETTFHIILDDGDDDITAIHLYHPADADGDEARNVDYEVGVDENDASEVIFGRIRVVDQDSADHPHGQHEVTVDNKKFEIKEDADGGFWLALKAGNALDHETDDPIELTITAKPMTVDSEGKIVVNKDATTHETQTVDVIVNDVNDAPKAIKNPGNWWVIVDDDEHDEDDVDAGDWLSFRLEMDDGDDSTTEYPAFTDEDDGKNGDLRYELVNAPDWLEIDDETGVIRNKAKMLAPESGGTFSVTVKATDNEGADDGLSDQFTFQLVVAFSGADDDDNLYRDNDEPQLSRGTVNDIRENLKDGVLVATFTVRDDDSALVGHPFAPRMPEITGVVNNDDEDDTNNDDGTAEDRSGYSTAFKIEHASGNSYRIVTTKDAGELLDYETVEDITISLSVEDGTGASDTLDISVDIDNVNEAPVKASGYAGAGNTAVAVEQSAAGKRYLWINLYDFWEDLDERQDDDDLTFTATANVPWIKVLHRPQKWEDLEEGKDDDDDDDDVTWGTIVTGTGDDQVTVVADDAGSTPDDDDFVVVFEIDRTKANNKQADVAAGGTITLTARDEGGAIAAKPETIKVNVTDENLDIGANEKAVTLSGSTREGATLKARFDETKDPDLVGDPEAYQVVYTWSAGASSDGTGGTVRQAGLSDSYTMTQADVGMYINVTVTYRELLPAGTTMDFGTGAAQTGGSAVTTGTVRNAQDDGEAHFNILTNGSTGLTAEVRIIDEDGVPNAGETGAPVYTWQQSANGVSGWEVADGDDVTTDQILTLANGNGLYYRLVVTYTDEQGGTERIASDGVKVGDVAALADTATPSLTGQWVIGGTQRVNAPEVKDVTVGVQWQMRMNAGTVQDPEFYWVDIAGATGRTLAITSDYAGKSLRVVVTHSDKDGITSTTILPSSAGQAISDTITNTAPRATMTEDYEIEAQIDDTKGVVVTKVTHTVPVATLFDDLDGDTLTYTVTAGPGTDSVPTVASDPKSGAIWISADDAGLLSFDANTGELIYVTDEKGSHGGDDTDGGGNVVSLTIQASDGTAQATTDVDIRLNVKPTDIMVDPSFDTSVVEGEKISANTTVATLNVEDENSGSHKFGTHKVTVDDDRFQVVKDTDTDGSTWLLQVKKDAVFEFMEVDDKNMPLPLDTAQNVKVKLTATDGGDKKATFTIMRDGKEVEVDYKEITVTALDITNATKDDADTPVPAAEIPGLDDDAEDGEADERVDGSGDDDVDGGWKPAEDMMSSIAMLDDGLF